MFGKLTNIKIIETLATIKESTANHKEDLGSFKKDFVKQTDKADAQAHEFTAKIEAVMTTVQNFKCPHDDKIIQLERRIIDNANIHERRRDSDEKRRISDLKTKVKEDKERAEKDKKVAEDIASLQSTRKYNYLTASGIYIILAAVLKKLFS